MNELHIDLFLRNGYWHWRCPEHRYGDLFLTRGRTIESIEIHLRTEHRGIDIDAVLRRLTK